MGGGGELVEVLGVLATGSYEKLQGENPMNSMFYVIFQWYYSVYKDNVIVFRYNCIWSA